MADFKLIFTEPSGKRIFSGNSTDTYPSSPNVGDTAYIIDSSIKEEYNGSTWSTKSAGGASLVKPVQSAPDSDIVPVSSTDYQLSEAGGGTGGAAGDYLSHINYFLSVASANKITIKDGADVVLETIGTQTQGFYHHEVKRYSKNAGFTVTTLGNSKPDCIGDFT